MKRKMMIVLAGVVSSVFASDIHVSPTGDGSDGLSWDTAFTNIQSAVDAAGVNDTIRIAAGDYALLEPLRLEGMADVTIAGAGAESTFVQPADGVEGRLINLALSTNVTFQGLTFRKGRVRAPEKGGALNVATSVVSFAACAFDGNSVYSSAAGTGNTPFGGAVYALRAKLSLSDCTFSDNLASNSVNGFYYDPDGGFGGAIYCAHASVAATNCVFRRNCVVGGRGSNSFSTGGAACAFASESYYGGSSRSSGTFTNCLFVQNGGWCKTGYDYAGLAHSTLYIWGNAGSRPMLALQNCTLADNATLVGVASTQAYGNYDGSVIFGHSVDVTAQIFPSKPGYYSTGILGNNPFLVGQSIKPGTDERPVFNRDYSQPATSPAYGLGYVPTAAAGEVPVVHVAPGGDDATGDGSAANPYLSLTKALSAAAPGSEVRLAAGRYAAEDGEVFPIEILGVCDLDIAGDEGGGTVLDAGFAANARHFRIERSQRIHFRNLTLTGANSQTADSETAGAQQSGAQCVAAKWCGGLSFENCAFSGNRTTLADAQQAATAFSGPIGLVYCSRTYLDACAISGTRFAFSESANRHRVRSAVFSLGSTLDLRRVAVQDNDVEGEADAEGAVVAAQRFDNDRVKWFCAAFLRNVLVAYNASGVTMKGLYATVESATVANNAGSGLALGRSYGDNLAFRNSIAFGNGDDLVNCGDAATGNTVRGFDHVLLPTGTDDYPQSALSGTDWLHVAASDVVLSDSAGFRSGTSFQLLPSSPTIDAGAVQAWMSSGTDLLGNPRLVGYLDRKSPLPDLGCYERPRGRGVIFQIR